jgi:hypothetical protein
LPTVGDTAANDAWVVTLTAYRPYEEVASQPVQLSPGRKLIVDATGRTIAPAGQTASIEKGFLLTWIQAGQTAEHRAVFEIDAEAAGLTLRIFELSFELPNGPT